MPTAQALGDFFAGTFGHDPNRAGLNNYVATAQAQNGLRSAQTDEALLNAKKTQMQMAAKEQYESALGALPDPTDPTKPIDPHVAHALATGAAAGYGNAKEIADSLLGIQQYGNRQTLSDPTKLNSPAQTAAQQGVSGRLAEPMAAHPEMVVPAGVAPPNVVQTPLGAAQTGAQNAMAGLHNTQASVGGYNPHTGAGAGGAVDPAMTDFGSYMLYKTGKMPALGMGAGPARAAIFSGAAHLAQREANGEDITNPGYETAIANGQDYTAGQRALSSYAGGPLGNQTRSLNNAVGHLQLIEQLNSALQNGDMQLYNTVANKFKKAFGYEAPTDVQTAAHVLGPELAKILSNSNAGTGPEREEFSGLVGGLEKAPEQMTGAIGTLKNMLGRQGADLALQYHGATKRSDFAGRYLAPDVAKYLELAPGDQPSGPAAAPASAAGPASSAAAPGAPIKIQNDDDYNKLPSGAMFIGPDGHTRRKP